MEETLLSVMKIWSAKITVPTASILTVKYFLWAVRLLLVMHTVNGATVLVSVFREWNQAQFFDYNFCKVCKHVILLQTYVV
jgi:hypothetical protein